MINDNHALKSSVALGQLRRLENWLSRIPTPLLILLLIRFASLHVLLTYYTKLYFRFDLRPISDIKQ